MHSTPPPLPLASATTIATTAGSRGAGLPRYPSPHRSHPHQITGARRKPVARELNAVWGHPSARVTAVELIYNHSARFPPPPAHLKSSVRALR